MTASDRNNLGTYHVTEDSYRQEWAALTGRSPADIYIPEGIRVNGMPTLEPKPQKKEHTDDRIKQSLIPLGATGGERLE